MSSSLLFTLRERIQRIERPAAAHGVLPLGIAAIDRALPAGGLARGALHEILGLGGDEEDGALAAAFAAGILGRLDAGGTVLWCLRRVDLYGPGLAACGLDPSRLVLVRAARDADILWAMEEGLRAPGIAAVVGEASVLPSVASRRLQLAAARSGSTAFLLRRWRTAGEAARERNLPNAATTRWRISTLPSVPAVTRPGVARSGVARSGAGEPGVGSPRWRVELLRCRGGRTGCWEIAAGEGKVTDAADSPPMAAALANRSIARQLAAPAEKSRRAG
jgi:protein ImuA